VLRYVPLVAGATSRVKHGWTGGATASMKSKRSVLLAIAVCVLYWTPAHAHHLAVVAQPADHNGSVTTPELRKIIKAEIRKWPSGENVVFVFNKNSAISLQIVSRLCSLPEPDAVKFFNKHKQAVVLLESDADVMTFVAGTPGAVGLVDVHSITNQVNVLKVDGKLPLEKGYLPH
jgi:ABC-type phosphate transport system substrate-binding protein